ncbi:hypothetical protein ABGB17_32055 [Sphaerisporangium sp. B11E5]|uniref:hypothetical protein n=1 Tax=Sphaerisporangium sp. B11E5 TaxID=3153563 RepID=UPI00325EA05A
MAGVLSSYAEIRDRIYQLARQHGLRVDWPEKTKSRQLLHLVDADQVVVAITTVPVRGITREALERLGADLEHLFGKDWMV